MFSVALVCGFSYLDFGVLTVSFWFVLCVLGCFLVLDLCGCCDIALCFHVVCVVLTCLRCVLCLSCDLFTWVAYLIVVFGA